MGLEVQTRIDRANGTVDSPFYFRGGQDLLGAHSCHPDQGQGGGGPDQRRQRSWHHRQDILPNLLDVAEDKVPNVRLMVARALKEIRQATYFTTEANPHHAQMDGVINELSEDKDADVRAFFEVPQAYDSDGEPIGDISSLPV